MLSRCCRAEMSVQAGESGAYYECVSCHLATEGCAILEEEENAEEDADV